MKIRDITIWESFFLVAKESNFTAAGKKLNIGTSQLSKRINKLEEDLGVRLFQRSTRKVKLTKDGEALLPLVENILSDLNSIEDKFHQHQEISGTIRISAVTAFAVRVLPQLIVEFNQKYPNVRFEVSATDELLNIIENQLDLAIRVQVPKGADFVYKKLLENKIVMCASPLFLKNLKKEIKKPQDLLNHKITVLEVHEKCKFIKTGEGLEKFIKGKNFESQNGLLLTEIALNGGGICVRSLWDVEEFLKNGKLVEVLPQFPIGPYGNVYAVIPTKKLLSQRVRIFLDFLEEKLSKK